MNQFIDTNKESPREELAGEVVAIIPARGGSKGIPRKNLAPLGGIPLLAWSIEVAKESSLVDRIVVSTDDHEIAEVSRKWGAEVPFLRPQKLANDTAEASSVIRHSLTELRKLGWHLSAYVVLFPSHPFRTPALVDRAIETSLHSGASTSLVSRETWNSGFWFYSENGNAHIIQSSQQGPVVRRLGIVTAGIPELARSEWSTKNYTQYHFRKFLSSPSPEKLEKFKKVLQSVPERVKHTRPPLPKFSRFSVISSENPTVFTDIDTPADLERANTLLKRDNISWQPRSLSLKENNVSKPLRKMIEEEKWPCSIEDVHITPVNKENGELSVESTRITLSHIGTPQDLRNTLTEQGISPDETVVVSRKGLTPSIKLGGSAPVISLNSGTYFPTNVGIAYASVNRTIAITHEGNYTATDEENWTVDINLPQLRVQTNPPLSDGEVLIISCVNRNFHFLATKAFRYFRENWEVLFPKEKDNLISTISLETDSCSNFKIPLETKMVWLERLRLQTAVDAGEILFEPVEIFELLSFDSNQQSWVDTSSGMPVHGRQAYPKIRAWNGWLYLPGNAKAQEAWSIAEDI